MNDITNRTIQTSIAVIKQNENIVGIGLWNIGNELKFIRDNETYQQMGFLNFSEFCENHLDYSKRRAYQLIEIRETYTLDNVQPVAQMGMRKLLALGKLEESERQEFTKKNPVPDMTVKEIEKKVREEMQGKLKEKDQIIEELENREPEEKEVFPNDYEKIKKDNLNLKADLGRTKLSYERIERQLQTLQKNQAPVKEIEQAKEQLKKLKKQFDSSNKILSDCTKIDIFNKEINEYLSNKLEYFLKQPYHQDAIKAKQLEMNSIKNNMLEWFDRFENKYIVKNEFQEAEIIE